MNITKSITCPGLYFLRTVNNEELWVTERELRAIVQQAFEDFDICPRVWTDAAPEQVTA